MWPWPSRPGDSQTLFITGSQDKKLEGTEVHTEGQPRVHALLRPFKGNVGRLRWEQEHQNFSVLSSPSVLIRMMMILLAPSPSVVLWSQLWISCPTVSRALSHDTHGACHFPLLSRHGRESSPGTLSLTSLLFSFGSSALFVFTFSQKTRRWRQLLWDHHFRWGSVLPAGGHSRRKEGLDQSSAGGGKMWQIGGKSPQWNLYSNY